MLEFNLHTLAVIVIITSLCLLSLFAKYKSLKIRLFLAVVFVFIFIYNGLGGALREVSAGYVWCYCLYIIFFSAAIRFFVKECNGEKKEAQIYLQNFINNYSSCLIILYLFILLLTLTYPELKLQLLLKPPMPDSRLHLEEGFETRGGGILYYVKTLLTPLYYIAISKQRNKSFCFVFLLILPLYISYCANSYISRNEILQLILLIGFIFFVDGSRRRKKIIMLSSILIIPFLLYAFYQYSNIRLGADIVDISLWEVVELLAYQEIKYPIYFDDFWGKFSFSALSYFVWLFLLPFPNFLKFGFGQMGINEEFTMFLTNLSRGDTGFFIILPGLINESLIIFEYFFFIHAIIFAYIVSLVINFCQRDKNLDIILFYMCFLLSFSTARAGTAASFPLIIKYVIVMVVFIFIIKSRAKSNKKCKGKLS